MANLVEFLIRLKDLASGPLQKMGNSGQTSMRQIEQGTKRVETGLMVIQKRASQTGVSLNRICNPIRLNIDDSRLKQATINIDQFQKKIDKANGSGGIGGGGSRGGGFGGSGGGGISGGGMGRFFRTGLAIAGIGSLAYLGKDIMQAGIGRQMDLTALQTLLGQKPGNMLNAQLVDFAKRSIYGNEVFNEGKLMAGSGIKAKNIMPVLSMIGDIAMGDKERMKSLALAFSEANTRGSLTGINERMFLQGGLFNPLEQLHKMTNRSLPDLKKDMEKGKISIDMLVKAMEYATGAAGRWHDMMKKMQATPAGKWTAFTGTLRTLGGTIGLALLPALGVLTDFMTALITNSDKLWVVAAAIGAMTAAWGLYTIVSQRAAIWQGILEVLAFWPLALVGALAGGITYLCLKYDNWGKSMTQVWGIAKNVGLGIYDIFKFATLDVGTLFHMMGLNIVASFQYIVAMAQNTWKSLKLLGSGDFAGSARALVAPIKTAAGIRSDALGRELAARQGGERNTLAKLFDKKQLNGLDFSMKNAKGKSPLDAVAGMFGGKYTPEGTGGPGGALAGDTSKAITGGGVRNITINVAKFQDKTEIHTVGLKEGVHEVEEMIRDMFLRITNSAATAMS